MSCHPRFLQLPVTQFFNPVTEEDVRLLEPTVPPVPEVPLAGSAVDKSDPPSQSPEDRVLSRIQSFPITQRLTAALLDEGKGDANAAKSIRSGLTAEETWIGGTPNFIKEYNDAYEERVQDELRQLGLLDPSQHCQVLTEIRKVSIHALVIVRNCCAALSYRHQRIRASCVRMPDTYHYVCFCPDFPTKTIKPYKSAHSDPLAHAECRCKKQSNEKVCPHQIPYELNLDTPRMNSITNQQFCRSPNAPHSEISKQVTPELYAQSNRRDKKVKDNQVEIKYLESMMEKGGKRGKGKFAKLLNQMHPNRNLLPGDPIQVNKPGSSSFDDKAISKKRKKKQASKERSAPKKQHQVDLEKTLHVQKVA